MFPIVQERERAARAVSDLPEELARNDRIRALVEAAAGNSPYLARLISREKSFLAQFFSLGADKVLAGLDAMALEAGNEKNEAAAMAGLRLAKRRAALAIALADLGGAYELSQVTTALSRFADACVKAALGFALVQAAKGSLLEGQGPDELEASTGMIVLAMGKHGALELNYSSDIDLIVFYRSDRFPFGRNGDTRSAAVAVVKTLVKLLSETTADGYVFRTDLRLRPDAASTQVAVTTEAAEAYYEIMGQNWERAALIKARAIAGDPDASTAFLKSLEPFIWRKSLDFAAIEDIHSIKRQIHAHSGHAKIAVAGHNIKLGRGGIREIEFFAQTQQLIAGGRNPLLREPRTVAALHALRNRGLISLEAERDLIAAYTFLRTLEHRLQMIDDEQTHTLPKTKEGLDHVARFMGYPDTRVFEADVLTHLRNVQAHYARLFEREEPLGAESGTLVFTGVENDPETLATLTRMGFGRAADISNVIRGWHHGRIRATRSARARERLTKLTPLLLSALSQTQDPDSAFVQMDHFLSRLPVGVQPFALLLANPDLLHLIAIIVGSAPRLAEHLGRHPGVLDALLDPDFFETLPTQEALQSELAELLARFPGYEPGLDATRRFAREEGFRIGVQVIEGVAQAAEAGPAYASLAETVIAGLQPLVEAEMAAAHGLVKGGALAVVAQGKLGGREMTAASDLDLIFLYTHEGEVSDGKKPLGAVEYFTRLSQRFIAALTARTAEGPLYEVDMRLRPSGTKGPLAVNIDTFATYHRDHAWTWERMALTRARAVSGPSALRREIEDLIGAELVRRVPPEAVLADARSMRERLAAHFPGKDVWDTKFAPGGLVDIEFIAQAQQLAHPSSGIFDQNTVAALEKLCAAGMLSNQDAAVLIDSARLQLALTQVLRIAVEGPFQARTASAGLKVLLAKAGSAHDFASLEIRLAASQKAARTVFDRVIPARAV